MRKPAMTSQPKPRQNATTAGPDKSSRSPLDTESLMVRTATLIGPLLRLDRVATGLVHEPHRFHQQAGGIAGSRGACGGVCRVEINFKLAFGPQNRSVNRIVAFEVSDLGVAALSVRKIQFTLLGAFPHLQATRLLAHLERLQQVGHTHLFKPPLNNAWARSALLKLLEVQPVDHFLRDAHQILDQKWLGDEFFHAVYQRTQPFFNVCAARHEQKRNMARLLAPAQLFKKLAAIEAWHLVVAEDHIGGFVDHFQQSVGAVGSNHYFADRLQPLLDQIAHQRIVVDQEEGNALAAGCCRCAHREPPRRRAETAVPALPERAFTSRSKSPLFPPVLVTRQMSVISI